MITKVVKGTILLMLTSLLLFSTSFAESAFERELVVKDQTRVMKVESVFKQLLQAYEDESASDFLALVSDERFRQDYITFTDALYSDFRKYEIKDVTYWIDRVTSDHIKQFLYVKWEKRYINLDDGRPGTTTGFSRFLFDEVNGKYLLIELAGNTLFGGSLKEWVDETPRISGEVKVAVTLLVTGDCGPGALDGCNQAGCSTYGGYWENGACYTTAEAACTANEGYWYDNRCNEVPQGKADLSFYDAPAVSVSEMYYEISNTGTIASNPCVMRILYQNETYKDENIPAIPAKGSYGPQSAIINGRVEEVIIDFGNNVDELTEGSDNVWRNPELP